MLQSSAAAQSGVAQTVELLGNRLAESTRLALPPPPAPVINVSAPSVNVQPLVQVNSASTDHSRLLEFMAHLYNQQREMMQHFHTSVESIAAASRDQSKLLVDDSIRTQGLLLSKFSESIVGAVQSQAGPARMLLPAVRQCIVGLAQTRAISTIQRTSQLALRHEVDMSVAKFPCAQEHPNLPYRWRTVGLMSLGVARRGLAQNPPKRWLRSMGRRATDRRKSSLS